MGARSSATTNCLEIDLLRSVRHVRLLARVGDTPRRVGGLAATSPGCAPRHPLDQPAVRGVWSAPSMARSIRSNGTARPQPEPRRPPVRSRRGATHRRDRFAGPVPAQVRHRRPGARARGSSILDEDAAASAASATTVGAVWVAAVPDVAAALRSAAPRPSTPPYGTVTTVAPAGTSNSPAGGEALEAGQLEVRAGRRGAGSPRGRDLRQHAAVGHAVGRGGPGRPSRRTARLPGDGRSGEGRAGDAGDGVGGGHFDCSAMIADKPGSRVTSVRAGEPAPHARRGRHRSAQMPVRRTRARSARLDRRRPPPRRGCVARLPSRACLRPWYQPVSGSVAPPIGGTWTMRPSCAWRMYGSASLASRIGPITMASTRPRASSSSMSSIAPATAIPALFTTTIGRNRRTTRSHACGVGHVHDRGLPPVPTARRCLGHGIGLARDRPFPPSGVPAGPAPAPCRRCPSSPAVVSATRRSGHGSVLSVGMPRARHYRRRRPAIRVRLGPQQHLHALGTALGHRRHRRPARRPGRTRG